MIVVAHTVYYVYTPLLQRVGFAIHPYGIFAMALFFFVSGFLLYYSHDNIERAADMLAFWKKRIIRIFPLYWLALISLFVLKNNNVDVKFDVSSSGMLIQLLGLQSLLAPRFINPDSIVWFVGGILIFYLVYPLIVYPSRKVHI